MSRFLLRRSTNSLLPRWVPEDLCLGTELVGFDQCVFLTHVFKSGHLFGWYSHSPWGRVHDQEQGYVIVDPHTREVIDVCPTRTGGEPAGCDFRGWLYMAINGEYGRRKKLCDFVNGELFWKISET